MMAADGDGVVQLAGSTRFLEQKPMLLVPGPLSAERSFVCALGHR